MAKKKTNPIHESIKETIKFAEKYGFLRKDKSGHLKLQKGFKVVMETFPTHDLARLSEESGYAAEAIALCGMVGVQLSKHNQYQNDELADRIMLVIKKFPEVQETLGKIDKGTKGVSPSYIG